MKLAPINGRTFKGAQANFPLCMAPMVGLSHVAFRLLVRRYLPAGARTIWPTEMLNSRRLPHEQLGVHLETKRSVEENDLMPQLLANEEEPIQRSVGKLREWGAMGIDINMGCPVQKALRHNYGVALMGDPEYASRIVGLTKKAAGDMPVSVKLRAGFQSDRVYLREFVRGLEARGADWVCLHPRLAEQKRRGQADWSQINFVREQVGIPVIGNGDVQTVEDVEAMLVETGCDMVMVGRALTARPWLFWQMGERWGWPNPPGLIGEAPKTAEQEGAEMGRALEYLIDLMAQHASDSVGVRRFQFFLRNAHVWLEYGHALSALASKARSLQDLQSTVREFFSRPHRMSQRTNLRY